MTAGERRRRGRGFYTISDLEIARMLNLPDGQHVTSVSTEWQTASVLIMVEGEGLPEIGEGDHAPYLNQHGWRRSMTGDRCDVAQLPHAAAHAAVLAELGAVRFEDPDARAGRRRILERHAPDTGTGVTVCGPCNEGAVPTRWPCIDYLDAAAGLVTGLPGQAEYAAAVDDMPARHVVTVHLPDDPSGAIAAAYPEGVATPEAPDGGDPAPARPGVEEHRPRGRRTPPLSRTTDNPPEA